MSLRIPLHCPRLRAAVLAYSASMCKQAKSFFICCIHVNLGALRQTRHVRGRCEFRIWLGNLLGGIRQTCPNHRSLFARTIDSIDGWLQQRLIISAFDIRSRRLTPHIHRRRVIRKTSRQRMSATRTVQHSLPYRSTGKTMVLKMRTFVFREISGRLYRILFKPAYTPAAFPIRECMSSVAALVLPVIVDPRYLKVGTTSSGSLYTGL